MVIISENLKIRNPLITDLADYLSYRNDSASLEILGMQTISEKKAAEFLEKQCALNAASLGWKMFSIEQKSNGAMVGEVGLFTSSEDPSKGDIGWWIGAEFRRQGIACEAAKSLIEWYFKNTQINLVTSACLETNQASIAVMKKIGMTLVCPSLESHEISGSAYNEVHYEIHKIP